jgi:hypothetical protein
MDEIIQTLSAKFNLPESAVRSGLGVLLNFLRQQAAGTEFETLLAKIPGTAEILAATPAADAPSAGGFLAGLLGGNLGGLAGVVTELQQAGVPLDKAAPLAGGFLAKAREQAGPEVVDAVLDKIPSLKALLGSSK